MSIIVKIEVFDTETGQDIARTTTEVNGGGWQAAQDALYDAYTAAEQDISDTEWPEAEACCDLEICCQFKDAGFVTEEPDGPDKLWEIWQASKKRSMAELQFVFNETRANLISEEQLARTKAFLQRPLADYRWPDPAFEPERLTEARKLLAQEVDRWFSFNPTPRYVISEPSDHNFTD